MKKIVYSPTKGYVTSMIIRENTTHTSYSSIKNDAEVFGNISDDMFELFKLCECSDAVIVDKDTHVDLTIQLPWENDYLTENIRNNLPAWSDKLLPTRRIDHILDGHSFLIPGRVNQFLGDYRDSIMKNFQWRESDFNAIRKSIETKVRAGESLTEREGKVIDLIKLWKKDDFWPINMNKKQIIKAIREAYEYAAKISGKQFPPSDENYPDRGPAQHGRLKYQGKTKAGLIVHFRFDFDVMEIETAYPILKDPGSIRSDKF